MESSQMEFLTNATSWWDGTGGPIGYPACPTSLFHRARRFVARLGHDLVLDRPAFFVFHGQRLVGRRIHQFYLDLAERAIVLSIAGLVGQYVLIPQRLVQHLENLRVFALKSWEVGGAARLLGEGFQFVIGLQEIQALRPAHVLVC